MGRRIKTGSTRAFTLIELLVVFAVIALLCVLAGAATGKIRSAANAAACANNLRQAAAATHLYVQEHDGHLFDYSKKTAEGTLWYFGLELGTGGAEGTRQLDVERGPLFPYLQSSNGIGVCPEFPYDDPRWKAKFEGPSTNYGFNVLISGLLALSISEPAHVILFGDCAQINTFQAPASPGNPMVEEFYIIDNQFSSIHFRHGDQAQFVFLDGHVERMPMEPGTGDTRMNDMTIGRITPRWSFEFLQ